MGLRDTGAGGNPRRASIADNHAPGARAVAGIVQELVVQIVDRIGVVIVKVKPFGHEQPFGICKIGVRREAGCQDALS